VLASNTVDTPQVMLEAAPRTAPAHVEQPVTSRWLALLQPVVASGRLNGFVRELAWQSECLVCDSEVAGAAAAPSTVGQLQAGELRVVLRVPRESLRQTQLRDRLQAALAEQLGLVVAIEVSAGAVTDSAALRDAAARGKRQADAEVLVHNHPLVKSLLAALPGACVLPGSIRPTGTPS
jgi:DNA polymerase-3 subunit gamma/tau